MLCMCVYSCGRPCSSGLHAGGERIRWMCTWVQSTFCSLQTLFCDLKILLMHSRSQDPYTPHIPHHSDHMSHRTRILLTLPKSSNTQGLALIPVSAFYTSEHSHLGSKMVRFCFGKVRPEHIKQPRNPKDHTCQHSVLTELVQLQSPVCLSHACYTVMHTTWQAHLD